MKKATGRISAAILGRALLVMAFCVFPVLTAYGQYSGSPGGCTVTRLRMRIATSNDDLRGGQDNLNIIIYFTSRGYQVAANVNHSQNWPNNSVNMVDIPLSQPVPPNEIRALRLVHISDGSFHLNVGELLTPAAPLAIAQAFQSPDNWNMADIQVAAIGNGVGGRIAGYGSHRFTGSDPDLVIPTHVPANICGSGRPNGNSGGTGMGSSGGSGMMLAPSEQKGMLAAQPGSPGLLGGNRIATKVTPMPANPNTKGTVGDGNRSPRAVGSVSAGDGGKSRFVLPPNLKVFTIGEARNPAALTLIRSVALGKGPGGGPIGPEGTMSAPGNASGGIASSMAASRPMLADSPAVQPNSAGPSRQQPPGGARPSGNSRYNTVPNGSVMACVNQPAKVGAVNGGRFTQFTPGTNYVITGCGFGTTPGKVYLTGAFPAHSGRIELGPNWTFGTQRSWTGHWSDQRIDAQLDEGLSGELDQNNVSLVVETSTGQQIQMGNVSFKAQRAEFMLPGIPSSAVPNPDPIGSGVSPCGAWVTKNCTAEVLRSIAVSGINPTSDYYTIKLKSGFVLSRVVLLVMSETNVTQWATPSINGNQFTVSWYWVNGPGSYKYSLYGVQIYVIGPLGVTDAWAGQ